MLKGACNFSRFLHTVKNFKLRSLFYKLFFIILFYSILFSIINLSIMFYINRIMMDKEINAQTVYMDYEISLINGRMANICSLINSLVVDSDFAKTLDEYKREIVSLTEENAVLRNINKLLIDRANDGSIVNLFVYVDGNDYVATPDGVNDSDWFFNKRFKDQAEKWRQLMRKTNRLKIVSADNNNEGNSGSHILYVLNSLYTKSKKMGTLVVEVDINDLGVQSTYNDFIHDRIVYLLDKDNEIICCLSDKKDNKIIKTIKPLLVKTYYISKQSGYLVQAGKIAAGDLNFIILTPMAIITGNISAIFNIATVIVFITFIIGSFLALYLSQRIYMPVLRVLNLIRVFELPGTNIMRNELDFIEKNVAGILKNYENMECTVAESMPLILEAILKKLIAGERDMETLNVLTKELTIDFKKGLYFVMIIRAEDTKKGHNQQEMEYFLSIGLLKKIKQYVNNNVISVFKTKENEVLSVLFIHNRNALQGVMQNCAILNEDIIRNGNEYNCVIGMGDLYESPYNVDKSYAQAIMAIGLCRVGRKNPVMIYDPKAEALLADNELVISNDLESRLFNYIISGNGKMATELVEDTLLKNYNRGISLVSYRSIVSTIQGYVRRIYDGIPQNLRKDIGFYNFYADEAWGVEEMNNIVIQNYKIITDYYNKMNNKDLFEDVLIYIDQNLHKDIGLENVADAVGLTPNYLTRYFKKQKGINFRYYINNKRIDKAKSILLKSNETVKEISALCGYNSSKQFISTFTKYVGITPMEFRRRNIEKFK